MGDQNPRYVWLERVYERVEGGAIDSSANLVAHVMAVRYMNGGREAWPSQPALAAATGLSPSTVRRALRSLEAEGLIQAKRGAPGLTSGCVYTLLLGGENGASGG